jgi:hypothetical protein
LYTNIDYISCYFQGTSMLYIASTSFQFHSQGEQPSASIKLDSVDIFASGQHAVTWKQTKKTVFISEPHTNPVLILLHSQFSHFTSSKAVSLIQSLNIYLLHPVRQIPQRLEHQRAFQRHDFIFIGLQRINFFLLSRPWLW